MWTHSKQQDGHRVTHVFNYQTIPRIFTVIAEPVKHNDSSTPTCLAVNNRKSCQSSPMSVANVMSVSRTITYRHDIKHTAVQGLLKTTGHDTTSCNYRWATLLFVLWPCTAAFLAIMFTPISECVAISQCITYKQFSDTINPIPQLRHSFIRFQVL